MAPRPLILAYHSLAELPREEDPHWLAVSPDLFRRQIQRLRRRGYRFAFASEVGEMARDGRDLRGICALTFDDGGADNATVLPPILEELDLKATLFVCPGLFGRPHPFFGSGSGLRIMSEGELLAVAGNPRIEVGSHTTDHTELKSAGAEEAFDVLASSRRLLEEILGGPVRSFAYPRCEYSAASPDAAARAGFQCAVTCGPSRGDWRPFELPRVIVDPGDAGLRFELKHRGVMYGVWNTPPGRLARALIRAAGRAPERAGE
jgi:peptidoglycan/xylan/chitin deacetylase (PgdA/CDA1 family)